MKDLMIVLYVDDAGIAAPMVELIDAFVDGLKAKGFKLTEEGSFSEFLGIKFEEDTLAGSIIMTQTVLIRKIIATTKMENCNPNWVPAAKEALRIDPGGKPMEEDWSYPSIIGMLLYPLTNTRPDIAFAVSQVARFNHNPKKSHATAIKMCCPDSQYPDRSFLQVVHRLLMLDNIYQSLTQSRCSNDSYYDRKMTQKPYILLTNNNPESQVIPQ
jgi:hypothetical protein